MVPRSMTPLVTSQVRSLRNLRPWTSVTDLESGHAFESRPSLDMLLPTLQRVVSKQEGGRQVSAALGGKREKFHRYPKRAALILGGC